MRKKFEVGDIVDFRYNYDNIHIKSGVRSQNAHHFNGDKHYRCLIVKDNGDNTYDVCNLVSKFLDVIHDVGASKLRFITSVHDEGDFGFTDEIEDIIYIRDSIYDDFTTFNYILLAKELTNKQLTDDDEISMLITKALHSAKSVDFYNIRSVDEGLDIINMLKLNYEITGEELFLIKIEGLNRYMSGAIRGGKIK